MTRPLPSLGSRSPFFGDVTTLQWIKPGHEAETCQALGYASDRLSQGYAILVALQLPLPSSFEFAGTTLRSGGREGKPGPDQASDRARMRVHDRILAPGIGETPASAALRYKQMQRAALSSVSIAGLQRLAKVLPSIGHDDSMRPDRQYPMGGGGLQWKLLAPGINFLVAAQIRPDGVAATPEFEVNVRTGGYEAKAKLRQFLATAI